MMDFCVFSDLDGTLLDHETYAWDAALPALELLKMRNIPLVLSSSKTAAEMVGLRQAIGFAHCPAIVENGGGILPAYSTGCSGEAYEKLRDILTEAPAVLRSCYQGFGDWTVEDVAHKTGLSMDAAKHAKDRHFSEPGEWSGSDTQLQEFQAYLAHVGVRAVRGGRFLTLSFQNTKADRMAEVIETLRASEVFGEGHRGAQHVDVPRVIAMGDAPNDVEMLKAAHVAVVVGNPTRTSQLHIEETAHRRVIFTKKAGPAGWNDAILELVE